MRPLLAAVAAFLLLLLAVPLPQVAAQTSFGREYIVHIEYSMEVHGSYFGTKPQEPDGKLTGNGHIDRWFNFTATEDVRDDGDYPQLTQWLNQTGDRKLQLDHELRVSNGARETVSDTTCDEDGHLSGPIAQVELSIKDGFVRGIVTPLTPTATLFECTIHSQSGEQPTQVLLPGHAEIHSGTFDFSGKSNSWGAGEPLPPGVGYQSFQFYAPLNTTRETTKVFDSTESGTFPADDHDSIHQYCRFDAAVIRDAGSGSCKWEGHLVVTIEPHWCQIAQDAFDAAYGDLRSFASSRPVSELTSPALLRAWQDRFAALLSPIFGALRQAQLLGCEVDEHDFQSFLVETITDVAARWRAFYEADPSLAPDYLAVERQAQLLGIDTPSVPVSAPVSSEGSASFSAHSPVSLHVYTEDGGHVGWNDKTAQAESTIDGATYEGRPGALQTIRVPAGTYRLVANELDDAGFLLTANWTAPGLEGGESMMGTTVTGRTTSMYYTIAKNATGGWNVETTPALRQTTASFAPGFERPLLSDPPPTVEDPNTLDATMFAKGDHGDATADEDAGAEGGKPTPAPGLLVTAIALVAAIALRRRSGSDRQ